VMPKSFRITKPWRMRELNLCWLGIHGPWDILRVLTPESENSIYRYDGLVCRICDKRG
jgi:hypothetical protein